MTAAYNKDVAIVHLLVEHGANVNYHSESRMTPLLCAAEVFVIFHPLSPLLSHSPLSPLLSLLSLSLPK